MRSDLVKAFELMVYFTDDLSGKTEAGIRRIHDPKLLAEMLNYCEKQREESQKYFTPTIEDLHVGYECEILPINESLGWERGKLSYYSGHEGPGLHNLYPFWYTTRISNYGRIMIHDFKHIRVPYLTTEEIEKEGWDAWKGEGDVTPYDLLMYWGAYKFEKPNYILIFSWRQRDITIYKKPDVFKNTEQIFKGSCPSINEFRTIMKLLNIK